MALRSQLRQPIQARRHNVFAVPGQGAQLEELLAAAGHEGAALVGQVDQAHDVEAVGEVVGQHGAVDVLGLADELHGARLVEEHVVHDAAPPGADAVRAAEARVADQRVAAAVEVAGRVVGAHVVLLGPVDLVVGEEDVVEAGEDGQRVRVLVQLAQVVAVLVQRARLVPALGHARVVLPQVEIVEVLRVRVVQRHHAEMLAEVGDVAAVQHAPRRRLRRSGEVLRVPWRLGERHRHRRLLEGHRRELRLDLQCCLAQPDGSCADGRACALPEGAGKEQILGRGRRELARTRVLDDQSNAAQLMRELLPAGAGQHEANALALVVQCQQRVGGQPHLGDRRPLLARPAQCGERRAAGAGPRAVVGVREVAGVVVLEL